MRRVHLFLGLLFLLFGLLPLTVAGRTAPPARLRETRFTDLNGRPYHLRASDNAPVVFFFLSTECPVARRYTSRILALERAFRPLGIRFFAVYPNPNESLEEIREHVVDWGLVFPAVRDSGALIKQFGISMTPEVVLLDRDGKVVYQGRIDDNVDSERVRSRDLASAILALQSGKPVRVARTKPFGCPLHPLPPALMQAKEQALRLAPPRVAPPADIVARGKPFLAVPSRSREVASVASSPLPKMAHDSVLPTVFGEPSLPALKGSSRRVAMVREPLPVSAAVPARVAVLESSPSRPLVAVTARTTPGSLPAVRTKILPAETSPRSRPTLSSGSSRRRLTGISRPTARKVTTSVTYTRDVAPILFERCLPCHRSGEVAPFRLDTYEQAVAWAGQIKDATETRRMPPWKAASSGEFHDEMRLTNRDVAVIASWVNGGMPFGDAGSLPPVPRFPAGWHLNEPDAIFALPEAYEVPADGSDIYRCFVIPTNFDEDRWVTGIEYQPGNRSVVHHVSAFIDTSRTARQLDSQSLGPGYTNPTPANGPGFTPVAGQLGGWVPGHTPRKLPPGVGIFLPRGADIVLEVHYHPTGKPEKDRTRFGLHFSKEEISKQLRLADITNANFRIPAGDPDYVVEATAFLPDDITLLSVSPHMHFLGRSMKVVATLPSGVTQVLVDVPSWDFRWQPSYRFKTPAKLPRRTRLDLRAHFDNSDRNPQNPNRPPREVVYGENTNDEMCSLFLAYTLDHETKPEPR